MNTMTFGSSRLYLSTLTALTREIANKPSILHSAPSLARTFTRSSNLNIGRHRISDALLTYARGGRALQELLDGRDEDKEEDDDTAVVKQLQWESPLRVLKYPDPRLRATNARIACFDDSLRTLAEEMFVLMYEDDGVGLAAPQVGVNVRMVVFNETGNKERKEAEVVLVNPRIVSTSKDGKVFEEGCLSFPKLYGDVIRPSKIRVKAQDLTGKSFIINIGGFPARIFQHEYDHLQGTLFCDRMKPDVLDELKKDLVRMEEEYIKQNPGVEIQRI